jgi:hypothetical protein
LDSSATAAATGFDAMSRPPRISARADLVRIDGIGPETPLRLDIAATVAYPDGSMTASGLRNEYKRGRLVIERTAGKDYTTLRAIAEMREKCRVKPKEPDCGSNLKPTRKTEKSGDAPHGSSVMERGKSALAALQATARSLSKDSATTSRANISPTEPATVVPLKSSSRMS